MTEEMIKGCHYLVEATSFEKMTIWKDYKDHWHQSQFGTGPTVGKIDGRPVCISVLVDKVYGEPVVFWHATSQAVDYVLIERFFKEHLAKDFMQVDAMNFHNVANDIKKKQEKYHTIRFEGIDTYHRPIFRSTTTRSRYGTVNILCNDKADAINKVKATDLVYFGNSFDCEPDGTKAPLLKIDWSL